MTVSVLAYPRFGEGVEFVVETDASTSGLRTILSQKQQHGCLHPIAYVSRKLQPAEVNYGITELETLGIVWAVKYFRSYLLGHKVILYSDHAACTSLLNCSNPSPKLARWVMIVQEMDLTIKQRSGRSNSNADTLSRLPSVTNEVNNESKPQGTDENTLPTCLNSCTVAHCVDGYSIPCEVQSRDVNECTASTERNSISSLTHVCSVSVPTDDDSDDGLQA